VLSANIQQHCRRHNTDFHVNIIKEGRGMSKGKGEEAHLRWWWEGRSNAWQHEPNMRNL